MRRAGILLVLLTCFQILLYAQESDDEPDVEPDWNMINTDMYALGDQVFNITVGTAFPTVFFNNENKINHNIKAPVGMAGSLTYNYFLSSNIFLGLDISGMVFWTLGKNFLYLVPVGVKAGYQFLVWKLEFPVSITLGMVWHTYLENTYYGFYIKGGASAFYRFNQEWSFGLNVDWYWLPEWTKDKSKNIDGNVIDLTLSVRYHF